jgi:hypothetical protein
MFHNELARLWAVVPFKDAELSITKQSYDAVMMRVCKLLVPSTSFDTKIATRYIDTDWLEDANQRDALNYAAFETAFTELAQLWSGSASMEDWTATLQFLRLAITGCEVQAEDGSTTFTTAVPAQLTEFELKQRAAKEAASGAERSRWTALTPAEGESAALLPMELVRPASAYPALAQLTWPSLIAGSAPDFLSLGKTTGGPKPPTSLKQLLVAAAVTATAAAAAEAAAAAAELAAKKGKKGKPAAPAPVIRHPPPSKGKKKKKEAAAVERALDADPQQPGSGHGPVPPHEQERWLWSAEGDDALRAAAGRRALSIAVTGAPWAGKTALCAELAKRLGLVHVEEAALLEAAVRAVTAEEAAKKAEAAEKEKPEAERAPVPPAPPARKAQKNCVIAMRLKGFADAKLVFELLRDAVEQLKADQGGPQGYVLDGHLPNLRSGLTDQFSAPASLRVELQLSPADCRRRALAAKMAPGSGQQVSGPGPAALEAYDAVPATDAEREAGQAAAQQLLERRAGLALEKEAQEEALDDGARAALQAGRAQQEAAEAAAKALETEDPWAHCTGLDAAKGDWLRGQWAAAEPCPPLVPPEASVENVEAVLEAHEEAQQRHKVALVSVL